MLLIQDGELTPIIGVVLGTDCSSLRHVEDPAPPAEGHECFRALFRRCTHEELRAWAKTLPWDHPIARKLDHEVHRRRMAGKFYGFSFFLGVGPFSLYLFFYFYRGIQGVRFSTNSAVACPPMSLPSTCQTQLGRAVLGSKLFVLIFFVR